MKYPYLSLYFQASYFWLHIKNIVRHIRLLTLILSNIIIFAKIWKISFFSAFYFELSWCWCKGANKYIIFFFPTKPVVCYYLVVALLFWLSLIFLRFFVGLVCGHISHLPSLPAVCSFILFEHHWMPTSMETLPQCQFRSLHHEILALEIIDY